MNASDFKEGDIVRHVLTREKFIVTRTGGYLDDWVRVRGGKDYSSFDFKPFELVKAKRGSHGA
jgi:hypothetical protein